MLAGTPAHAAPEKTVYAPIDGYVLAGDFSIVNGIFDAKKTRSNFIYDKARFLSKLKPIHFPDKTKAFVAVDLTEPLEKSTAIPADFDIALPILKISSDLLEIQLAQEQVKFENARRKYLAAKERYDAEVDLKPMVIQRLTNSEIYRNEMALESYYRNRRTVDHEGGHPPCTHPEQRKDCTGAASAQKILDADRDRSEAEKELTSKRYALDLKEFDLALETAKAELEGLSKSLLAIEATIALGEVSCPVRCKIKRVHVAPNQYVNKGDPLFSYLWMEE